MSVLMLCSDGPINIQEYTSFDIDAVTITIFMAACHYLINRQILWFILTQQSMGENDEGISGHL